MKFTTRYEEVLESIDRIDPSVYTSTRNYYHGQTSRLSPYISRGMIDPMQIKDRLLQKFPFKDCQKFIYELAWREYFQRCWWKYGDRIFDDMRKVSSESARGKVVKNMVQGSTGIHAIDREVNRLITEGYIHNHARMHIASLSCNIARVHWSRPAQWMYYHLLDGDLASNTLSWQWVAGTFSSKKYWFNQKTLNEFSGHEQHETFLDHSYEEVSRMEVPSVLVDHMEIELVTWLPDQKTPKLDYSLPLLLYNSYNIDPAWRKEMPANRILVLEPSHFRRHPVSEPVMEFILALSSNVEGIQIFSGEVENIPGLQRFPNIYSKAHPSFMHYPGVKDSPTWMFPEAVVEGSFSSFWKSCKAFLPTTK